MVFCSVTTWSLPHAVEIDINQTLPALGKTNGCFQVQARKCQRCSPDRLAVSWGVVVLLELNAEGSHEHMRTSLGALEE